MRQLEICYENRLRSDEEHRFLVEYNGWYVEGPLRFAFLTQHNATKFFEAMRPVVKQATLQDRTTGQTLDWVEHHKTLFERMFPNECTESRGQ